MENLTPVLDTNQYIGSATPIINLTNNLETCKIFDGTNTPIQTGTNIESNPFTYLQVDLTKNKLYMKRIKRKKENKI